MAPFDAIFVAGGTQARRLRAAGVREVMHVPFGVDARSFRPTARSEARRQELLGESAGPLLVSSGRLAFEKRWDVVIEAFGRVRDHYPGAVLALFGDGPERKRLATIVPTGVRFLGFEPERARLASALASADALVHGCPYETFGLAVAEAAASGTPVVVPDAGGALESAVPTCAEIYPSLDVAGCAAAIERTLRRRERAPAELIAAALEAASNVPTMEGHFARVLATYGDLLASRERGIAVP